MVDLEEIILAFKDLGIDIDRNEATKLLERYELADIKNIPIYFCIPLVYYHIERFVVRRKQNINNFIEYNFI